PHRATVEQVLAPPVDDGSPSSGNGEIVFVDLPHCVLSALGREVSDAVPLVSGGVRHPLNHGLSPVLALNLFDCGDRRPPVFGGGCDLIAGEGIDVDPANTLLQVAEGVRVGRAL